MLAQKDGRYDLLAEAINTTVDVNARERSGRSLLDQALEKNRFELAKFLVNNGADVESPYNGMSLLYYAVQSDQKEKVRFLLENGASPNCRNKKGLL